MTLATLFRRLSHRKSERTKNTYPNDYEDFIEQCVAADASLLQYVPGDFNCLHQDLSGELTFPIQVVVLLSKLDEDFTSG